MRLDRALVRLPLTVDVEVLAAEVAAVDEALWRDHPEAAPGNTALPVLARGGDPDDDRTDGPMAPTPVLESLPYTRQVLAALDSTIGRTRFMRIAHETELKAHVDINYYWWHHLRVHVPVVSTPDVVFEVGGESAHMAPGEVWAFDTWSRHRVDNPADTARIHLVVDTVGGPALWQLVAGTTGSRRIDWRPGERPLLRLESSNWPLVMPPDELDGIVGALLTEAEGVDPDATARVRAVLDPFRRRWRDLYAQFGLEPAGFGDYLAAARAVDGQLDDLAAGITLGNGADLARALRQLVVLPAVRPGTTPAPLPAPSAARRRLAGPPRITRPVFVVSPPRSGSTLLFETLARAPEVFTIGGESHREIESIASLTPAAHDWDSNRLTADDATEGVVAHLKDLFVRQLRDRDGRRAAGGPVRFLEKTPKNALRVPFLAAAFPDAAFVYLYRDPRETVSSMLDAWRSEKFVTYSRIPGWPGPPWSLLLVPGWRDLVDRPLPEIVARQWAITTEVLLDDLAELDPDRWCVASYDRLVADTNAEIAQLASFLDFVVDVDLSGPLPESRHTLDSPNPEKWRRNAAEIEPLLVEIDRAAARARDVFASAPRTELVAPRPTVAASPPAGPAAVVAAPVGDEPTAEELFHARFSASFRVLLEQTGISLAVTTYQAGRLILLRADGSSVNSHYRAFDTPMGIAYDGRRLAIGLRSEVVVFQNQPALAARLTPPDQHDGCFVPRARYATGDLRVHDLAWAGDELWLVNTRFSCLATLDGDHSFVPRWRPPFVTALAAEDRCHLNGLAVVDGRPAYVTALGLTDSPSGWRERKANGGAILDVESGDIVTSGLSMPHSPRWYRDRLWVLESGRGMLRTVDVGTGAAADVAAVPGFARGLTFVGDYAIIGLSQVREHAFDGLPLTRDGGHDLRCGVWVVDTTTGETVALLSFEGLVQEIFEVALLPGLRFPELVEPGAPLGDSAFVVPESALADVH
jgi:uncharacterized protein (TIGR03032 family)